MPWAIRFRARQYLKGSLWCWPLAGAILGPLLAVATRQADASATVPAAWQYPPSTASTVLTTIVGATVGLTGFVVTVTVLAIQMATGTFSARYMRIWYRDPLLKAALAVLAGTLTFSFSLLRQVGTRHAPNIGVTVAGFLLVCSLILFLFFFDRFIHRLRPVAVAGLVAQLALGVINTVTRAAESHAVVNQNSPGHQTLTVTSTRPGSVQAINVGGLVAWASKHDCLIVIRAAVGDAVTTGQPLIDVQGDAPAKTGRRLRQQVALGAERTIDQDAAFAIRIIADIAVKALSAAINDPTTAVQALDHLADVLRLLGSTPLHAALAYQDQGGSARVLMPGRTWSDYLTLAVTEIREYGASTIQIARRLRAMLEDLQQTVLPEHRPAVDTELARLDSTVSAGFASSADQDRAITRDRQGIGGQTERHNA